MQRVFFLVCRTDSETIVRALETLEIRTHHPQANGRFLQYDLGRAKRARRCVNAGQEIWFVWRGQGARPQRFLPPDGLLTKLMIGPVPLHMTCPLLRLTDLRNFGNSQRTMSLALFG